MYGMFENCQSLKEIDVSKFDTGNVYTVSNMFKNCERLKKINIREFNTKNLKFAHSMFENCYDLTSVHLCKFHSTFKDSGEMFNNCKSLSYVTSDNTSYAHAFQKKDIFNECINLLCPADSPEK